MARIAWIVAAIAIVAAALLGWGYSSARQEAASAKRAVEAEQLKAKDLLVVEQRRRADAEKLAKELKEGNDLLRAEVERVSKLVPGTKVSAAGQLVTQDGMVVNALARPMKPCACPVCPAPAPRAPRVPPRRHRAPAPLLENGSATASEYGGRWVRLASLFAAAADADAASGGSPPPGHVRSEPATVADAAPRRATPSGRTGTDQPEEVCVLALGDTTNVEVEFVTLQTEAGNRVVVGTATMNRLKPEPVTPLARARFDAGKSQVIEAARPRPEVKGRGWGIGVHGAGWDGGRTVGPVLALPTLRAWGHSLEAAFTVGVAPDFQVGAMAIARY